MNPAQISTIATSPTQIKNGILISCVPGVIGVDLEVSENGRTGTETTIHYEGDYWSIKGQQSYLRNFTVYQMALKRVGESTRYLLQATFPYDENGQEPVPILGVYELDIEMQEPSVFSNPILRAALPDNYIALVARVCSNFEAGQYSMTGTSGTDGGWSAAIADISAGITDPDYQARGIQLFATVCALKTESSIQYYSVFKRTLTAASPQQVQASRDGEAMIWTSDEVTQWEDIAPNGWFQLPATSQWLKSKANVTVCAGQKTQVTYSYTEIVNGQANGLLYKPYASAQLLYASVTDLPPES
jgi:hypothetical protein